MVLEFSRALFAFYVVMHVFTADHLFEMFNILLFCPRVKNVNYTLFNY